MRKVKNFKLIIDSFVCDGFWSIFNRSFVLEAGRKLLMPAFSHCLSQSKTLSSPIHKDTCSLRLLRVRTRMKVFLLLLSRGKRYILTLEYLFHHTAQHLFYKEVDCSNSFIDQPHVPYISIIQEVRFITCIRKKINLTTFNCIYV